MAYWPAQLVFWGFAAAAAVFGGWFALATYIVSSIVTSLVIAWQMLRADAIRPQAEWSDTPIPPRDWVT